MMKKKLMVSLLTASLIAVSVVPAYGAEFTSEPVEAAFSAGEELVLEEPEELEEVPEVSKAESLAGYHIEVVNPPKRTSYHYEVDIRQCYQYNPEGLSINKVLDNGEVDESITFGANESWVEGDSGYLYEWTLWNKAEERTLDRYDPLLPGEYELRIASDEDASVYASIDVHVGDARDTAPLLQNSGKGHYELTVPMNSDVMVAWAKIVPENGGIYNITALESEPLETPRLSVKDDHMNEVYSSGDNNYLLEQGKAYYISYAEEEEYYGMQLDVTFYADELPQMTGMEWVEKPANPYLYSGLSTPVNEKNGKYVVYVADHITGKVKLTYSDGYSEVVNLHETNRYKKRVDYLFYVPAKETPKPGMYESYVKVDGIDDIYVTGETEVKSIDTIPLINVEGSQTVEYDFNHTWIRLKTGSTRVHSIEVNVKNEEELHFLIKDRETNTIIFMDGGRQEFLDPNKEYIIWLGGINPKSDYESITFTIKPGKFDISKDRSVRAELKSETAAYTGKPIKMGASLICHSKPLRPGKDYTVSYKNNVKIGNKATVIFTGKGEYTGTIKKTFQIVPRKVALKSAKRTGNTSAKLTWKKVSGATGYIVYRTTGKKWVKVANVRGTSFTDKGLKKGTRYKYKVRAYSKVGKKNVYGAYSSSKTVK